MQERIKSHETVKHLLSLLRTAWQERDEALKERDEARNDLQALLNKILSLKPITTDHHHNGHHTPNLPDFTDFYPPLLVEEPENISDTYCLPNMIKNKVQGLSDSLMISLAAGADHNPQYRASSPTSVVMDRLVSEGKALPEKGRLLQAVVEAGPLLHTLLLAPIPQWKNPPPPLPLPPPLPNSCSLQISHSNFLNSPTAFDHVSQMLPSSCLDIAEQMINPGSGPNLKSQSAGYKEDLASTCTDYVLSHIYEN